jgi:hypothetical protein
VDNIHGNHLNISVFLFQHIDSIMSVYGTQIMQAVVFILEGDHLSNIKEQVSWVI